MAATFSVAAPKGTKVTVYSNGLGKLPALLVIRNVENHPSNGAVEAGDDKGTPYIAKGLQPGEAIAITVPGNTPNLLLFNLNDILKAEVQITPV